MKYLPSIVGLALAAFGGYLLWDELRQQPVHPLHLWIVCSVLGVGLILVSAHQLAQGIVEVGAALRPFIPFLRKDGAPPQ